MQSFYGKTAVVTGAASGIGRAIAKRCAQYDMKVVLADIDQSALNKTENDLRSVGADVSKPDDVETLAQKTLYHFGNG